VQKTPGRRDWPVLGRSDTVIRLIKRYGSRKLYDTEESRYVSLEEIGDWVRQGQQVQVIDNQNSDDVTAQTLTQVILEEGKRGVSPVTSDFLHDLIRRGEQVVSLGVQSVQDGVDRLLQASVDRVPPLRQVRDETDELRHRLEALEASITEIERDRTRSSGPNGGQSVRGPAKSAGTGRKKGASS
jgi:polyhydroxyalkanoate synthesis repressor PhaR